MGEDGLTLRWLYPNSQFVVIVRHPVYSFNSILQSDLQARRCRAVGAVAQTGLS